MSHPTFSSLYKITRRQNEAAGWATCALNVPSQTTTSETVLQKASKPDGKESVSALLTFLPPGATTTLIHRDKTVLLQRPRSWNRGLSSSVFCYTTQPWLQYGDPRVAIKNAFETPMYLSAPASNQTYLLHGACHATQVNFTENLFQKSLVLCPSSSFDQILGRIYSSCWVIFTAISSVSHKRHLL